MLAENIEIGSIQQFNSDSQRARTFGENHDGNRSRGQQWKSLAVISHMCPLGSAGTNQRRWEFEMVRSLSRFSIAALVLSMTFWAGPATGQGSGTAGATPLAPSARQLSDSPDWGTQSFISYAFNPRNLVGWNSTEHAKIEAFGVATYCSATCYLDGDFDLPQGALVSGIEIDAYDSDPAGEVLCYFYTCPLMADSCSGEAPPPVSHSIWAIRSPSRIS